MIDLTPFIVLVFIAIAALKGWVDDMESGGRK